MPDNTRAALVLLLGAALLASPALATAVPARDIAVIDGDTLRVGERKVRIRGLDAPESRSRCERERLLAQRARQRLEQLVAAGIVLDRVGRDRYGRMLAEVRDRGGRDLAQVMIREGLAVGYEGQGRRQPWCD